MLSCCSLCNLRRSWISRLSRSISEASSSSVGKYIWYLLAKSCSLPLSMEYLTTVYSFSVQRITPMVGLSSSPRFKSSNIRTYISTWPMSWWLAGILIFYAHNQAVVTPCQLATHCVAFFNIRKSQIKLSKVFKIGNRESFAELCRQRFISLLGGRIGLSLTCLMDGVVTPEWRTLFRRDHVDSGTFYYNVDGEHDLSRASREES